MGDAAADDLVTTIAFCLLVRWFFFFCRFVGAQWLDNATQSWLYLESMLQEAGAGEFNVHAKKKNS